MDANNDSVSATSGSYPENVSESKCAIEKSLENSVSIQGDGNDIDNCVPPPPDGVMGAQNVGDIPEQNTQTSTQLGQNSVTNPVGQNKGKMRIDPQMLLNCLSALLNSNGGIKSFEEVQRMAGLMRRYSKKFVSKCIYLNILQATDSPLLDEFYKETGWSLVNDWLSDSQGSRNWPLTEQILSLLLMSPITVERLKMNGIPKLVKDISKECPHEGAKGIAEKVVQHWKYILTNIETISHPLNSVDKKICSTVAIEPNSDEPSLPLPNSENSKESMVQDISSDTVSLPEKSDQLPEEDVPAIESSPPPYTFIEETTPSPPAKRGRKRGRPRTPRGAVATRSRLKRLAASGRGAKANSLSYAELLALDINSSEPQTAAKKPEEGSAGGPIRITIRSGSKGLAVCSQRKLKNRISSSDESEEDLQMIRKPKRLSIDSTDSDDNKPLSMIKRRCRDKGNRIATGIVDDDDDDVVILEDDDEPSESKKSVLQTVEEETEDIKILDEVDDRKAVEPTSEDAKDKEASVDDIGDIKIMEPESKPAVEEEGSDEKASKKEMQVTKEDKDSNKRDNERKKEKASKKDKHNEYPTKSKDREKEQNKDRDKRDRDKDRHKTKNNNRHRSHRDDKDKKRQGGSDKRDHKDRGKRKDEERKERERRKDYDEKEQRVKETLDKIKPLSTEGLSKIPRKSSREDVDDSSKRSSKKSAATVSFLDALGSADSDSPEVKKPPVKVKSRGFRSTGLLEETINPPGVAGKRSGEVKSLPPPVVKRQNSLPLDGGPTEKRIKPSVSSLPITADRPGGSKLTSPKRPAIADDGGFMAALAASATPDRKKMARKRRSSESDPKEGPAKALRSGDNKDIQDDGSSPSKETLADPLPMDSDNDPPVVTADETTPAQVEGEEEPQIVSPTSIKPTLNFYKETLTDDKEEDKTEKEPQKDENLPTKEPSPSGDEEPVEEEEEKQEEDAERSEEPQQSVAPSSADDPKKEDDNMEIVDSDDNALNAEKAAMVPAAPAPVHEDYEKVEVTFSAPKFKLKSVMLPHNRPTSKKKKSVQWRGEEELKEVFFFTLDEQERVNVNTVRFQDMMMMEKAKEKEEMIKHRSQMGGRFYNESFDMPQDNCIEYMPWKLYPIHLPGGSKVDPGYKSKEKNVQAQRELSTMGAFFHPSMRPETPKEPDPELVPRAEPISIPLGDVNGQDCITDNRDVLWPEPVFNQPSDFPPFMGGSQMPPGPPANSGGGGHWVVGNHPASRFPGAPPLFGGPSPPQGPPGAAGPPPYGGQGFGGDMRGGWGPPNDFSGPSMMMGPGMMGGGGPGMGGPSGPPNMGPPGPPGMGSGGPGMPGGGPNMGMPMMNSEMGRMGGSGGGRGPGRGGGPRYNRRGGGNWGGPPSNKPCQFFMSGHCKNGQSCRFSHDMSR